MSGDEGRLAAGLAPPEPYLRAPLPPLLYEGHVRAALLEDLGRAGDLTSDAVLPGEAQAEALLVARRAGRIAGLAVGLSAFRLFDPSVSIEISGTGTWDGADAEAGTTLAIVRGAGRSVLAAERTALNYLGHLSGIATATRDLVARVAPYGARIAVRMGGGSNHRFGLDDAILIKDNHRALAGGVRPAVERARAAIGHLVKIEVEVETLDQLDEALACRVEAVLLDNMPLPLLREAVQRAKGRAITEASGGITPETAAEVASTGVDLLSIGWITHSAPNLDVALDVTM